MKKKIKTVSSLKKKADKVFSLFIRQRGANGDYNKCYTCRKIYLWKRLQCGHLVSRTHSATRYSELNCQPQCFACNIWRQGNIAEFIAHFQEDYGKEKFDELVKLGRTIKQFSEKELEAIISKYAIIKP